MSEHFSQALADLRRSREEVKDAQTESRQVAFDLRRTLDDPTLPHYERTLVEDQLFDVLKGLKDLEQAKRNTDEAMASIEQQRRDEENFGAIFLLIVGLILLVVVAIALSG